MKKFTEREGTRGTRADREKWKTRGDQDKKREGRVAKQIAEEPPWIGAAASGVEGKYRIRGKGKKNPGEGGSYRVSVSFISRVCSQSARNGSRE